MWWNLIWKFYFKFGSVSSVSQTPEKHRPGFGFWDESAELRVSAPTLSSSLWLLHLHFSGFSSDTVSKGSLFQTPSQTILKPPQQLTRPPQVKRLKVLSLPPLPPPLTHKHTHTHSVLNSSSVCLPVDETSVVDPDAGSGTEPPSGLNGIEQGLKSTSDPSVFCYPQRKIPPHRRQRRRVWIPSSSWSPWAWCCWSSPWLSPGFSSTASATGKRDRKVGQSQQTPTESWRSQSCSPEPCSDAKITFFLLLPTTAELI